ncbi:MAG: exo-alpha-sialidase [Bryobacterales bacterium]|nr:exo-alpha-sialidase [Bryobacterales bacterium]
MRLAIGLFGMVAGLWAAPPEIVTLKKIWDQAGHSAFTDLIRFRNQWYCSFREAETHTKGDGKLRVLVSKDSESWQSAALLEEKDIDLRDPKLNVTPDGRLMMVAGGSVRSATGGYATRRPRVAFSKDGKNWGQLHKIMEDEDWLWRVTWHKGRAYGVSYRGGGGLKTARSGALYSSTDGLKWEKVTQLETSGTSETTLRFAGDEMIAMVRCEYGERHGQIGVSKPPYKEWKWFDAGERFGGPNFIVLPDGSMVAGSRQSGEKATTVLARMGRDKYEPVLTLPSGGDTSYPGLVWHENMLWVSYYSTHEGKTSIYLAKVRWK